MLPHPVLFFACVFIVYLLLALTWGTRPSGMSAKEHFLAEVLSSLAVTASAGLCYGTRPCKGGYDREQAGLEGDCVGTRSTQRRAEDTVLAITQTAREVLAAMTRAAREVLAAMTRAAREVLATHGWYEISSGVWAQSGRNVTVLVSQGTADMSGAGSFPPAVLRAFAQLAGEAST